MAGERVATGTYRAVDWGISWSLLKAWRTSPRHGHYAEITGYTDSDSPDLLIGRAVDTALLEPAAFDARFAVWEGEAKRGAEWTAFKAAHEGRDILSAAQLAQVRAMRDAVASHPYAPRYLMAEGREVQVRRQWTDDATGTRCKGQFDCLPWPACVVDLKSTRSLDRRRFEWQARDLGWWHQLAWYRRGQAAHLGVSREFVECVIVAVDKTEPYDCAVVPIDPEDLEWCDAEIDALLVLRKKCRESGSYPGRYPQPVEWRYPLTAEERDDDEMTLTIGGDDASS